MGVVLKLATLPFFSTLVVDASLKLDEYDEVVAEDMTWTWWIYTSIRYSILRSDLSISKGEIQINEFNGKRGLILIAKKKINNLGNLNKSGKKRWFD